MTAERLADRKNAAIELALTQAGAKNITAVKALLKADELEMTDEGIKGLDEKVATLKKMKVTCFNPMIVHQSQRKSNLWLLAIQVVVSHLKKKAGKII
ncbi:phage scaffolding protein [Enterococcus mundtii]|nr:phage scaffolding protein [Enterococcus mundtii]